LFVLRLLACGADAVAVLSLGALSFLMMRRDAPEWWAVAFLVAGVILLGILIRLGLTLMDGSVEEQRGYVVPLQLLVIGSQGCFVASGVLGCSSRPVWAKIVGLLVLAVMA
jgi:hypothetical protein